MVTFPPPCWSISPHFVFARSKPHFPLIFSTLSKLISQPSSILLDVIHVPSQLESHSIHSQLVASSDLTPSHSAKFFLSADLFIRAVLSGAESPMPTSNHFPLTYSALLIRWSSAAATLVFRRYLREEYYDEREVGDRVVFDAVTATYATLKKIISAV